ncbi:hypothetical protein BDW22DRAFT_1409426 [Trametopsis cervina]|nr:hypothetical protein BDW22DRAFT_1409426 [Trametopsis cervina]
MMRVVRDTDPTHYIRRALTAGLGIPLAAEALVNSDTQGSLGLYSYEGKDRRGDKSKRFMCLTNKHVTSSDTTKVYDYGRPGAPQQFADNCGCHRFQQVVDEARALIATKLGDTWLFAEQLADMATKPKSEDEEEAIANKEYKEWNDAYQRIIGYLDCAPKIAQDLDTRRYTRHLGVIALHHTKFKDGFQGSSVYLAGKYTRNEIELFVNPNSASQPYFKYPNDHLFRLSRFVDSKNMASSYILNENGNAGFIVAKDGQSTDLTFGRFSELEAYTCDNKKQKHGSFSIKGDSSVAIFNAEGKLVAILHSSMPRGISNHVTFGNPGHYVVGLIKEHYSHANFDRLKFNCKLKENSPDAP